MHRSPALFIAVAAAVLLAERVAGAYASVGIHPHDAAAATDADYADIERLGRESPKVVALGEMGLDYFRNLSPRDAQVGAFRRQLRLAHALGKPAIVQIPVRSVISPYMQFISK